MTDRLSSILEEKRVEVDLAKRRLPLSELRSMVHDAPEVRDFLAPLRRPGTPLIAEIKKASPSRGSIVSEFDPVELAVSFEAGGARALSVLTDRRFFEGSPEFIHQVKDACSLPVLRKDFILEEYQVYESRVIGADAILLIVRALSEESLRRLSERARELGLAVLVEVHTAEEVVAANSLHPQMMGVNNRDLSDFSVSLERSIELRPAIEDGCLTVSESGIRSRDDIRRLQSAGYDAFLVGETLMASNDRTGMLRDLIGE